MNPMILVIFLMYVTTGIITAFIVNHKFGLERSKANLVIVYISVSTITYFLVFTSFPLLVRVLDTIPFIYNLIDGVLDPILSLFFRSDNSVYLMLVLYFMLFPTVVILWMYSNREKKASYGLFFMIFTLSFYTFLIWSFDYIIPIP